MAIGHDCYLNSTGGIQIFTADEQSAFKTRGICYIHLSPVDPDLVLAKPEARSLYRIAFDGAEIGIFSDEDIIAAMNSFSPDVFPEKIFIVHSLLGHNIDRLINLNREFSSSKNYFWIHDYTSVCAGFNLLRDDVQFCHAPPVTSLSCQVCIYGRSRLVHLSEIRLLFESIPFTVLAPSEAALNVWSAGSQLPNEGAYVHEHCRLERNAVRMEEPSVEPRGEAR